MNDTLKVAMGAELGAAKAENEKLRGLLTTAWRLRPDQHYHEDHLQAEQKAWEVETAEVLNAADALPQQAEPTDAFTAVDMATAAAQGFRDGQAAVEQAPAQDEREYPHEAMDKLAIERYRVGAAGVGTLHRYAVRAGDGEQELYRGSESDCQNVARKLAGAFLDGGMALWNMIATRPAQTEQQPEQSGKFAMHQRVRKTSGSEWQGRICGTYSTALTPEGYAVESEAHAGSVQIYPAKALEAVE